MEMQICSGCQLPTYGRQLLVPMQHGFICGECVNLAVDQVALARRRDERYERFLSSISQVLRLVEPRATRWCSEWEVRALDVLAQKLSELADAYAYRSGAFAVVVDYEAGLDDAAGKPADTDEAEAPTVLRLVELPSEPRKPASEILVYKIVCALLNTEILNWPTPNMVQLLERHGNKGEDVKAGIQAMLNELRGHCEFLEPRPPLALVRAPDEVQAVWAAPPSDAGVPLSLPAAPHHVTISAGPRCWIERLEGWIKSVGLSPETLASRAKRERAAVVSLFGQTDRQTSLRRFLDLVRSAGACLCGAPDATPTAVLRRLREIVSQQGLTIATLAQRTGINRSQLSGLFNSPDPNPCLWTVQRIVVALNCDHEMMLVKAESEVG